ncbi:MAG: tetratricopeptide repeat protein [Candidatus Melainabacteria bacterium]|jgi:tetratricopeptide (TPR) repeat protein|nr:tetratricopeptide repeat protein [Candidatus Melainabacteria bacterium]
MAQKIRRVSRVLKAFGLTLALSSVALVQSANLSAKAYIDPAYDQGIAKFKAGEWDAAATLFGESIGLNPTNAKALLMRGECFYKMENYKLAIEDLTSSLNYAPNSTKAHLLRGSCHSALGRDAMAILDYEAAIRMDSDLGKKYFAEQSDKKPGPGGSTHKAAVANYEQAMHNVYPNGYTANLPGPDATEPDTTANARPMPDNNGSGSGKSSKNGRASGGIPREDNPSRSARLRTSSGSIGAEQAVADPRQSGTGETNAPNGMPYINTDAANNSGLLSSDTMSAAKNNRHVDSLDQDPDRGDIGPLAGTTVFEGDAKKAIIDYGQGLKLDPTNAEYYFRRARAYQALFKVNDAMNDFRDAISQSPNNARYYLGRASLFYQLGKTVLLQADIESARNCDPDLPAEIHFRMPALPKGVTWASDGPD